VVEEYVGEFVGDVAVGARGVVAGVGDGGGPAVGQVEGGGGEGAGLEPFEFFGPGAVDKVVGGMMSTLRWRARSRMSSRS